MPPACSIVVWPNLRGKRWFSVLTDTNRSLGLLWLFFFVSSCASSPGSLQIRQSTDLAKRNVKRIAIFPSDPASAREKTHPPYSSVIPAREKGVKGKGIAVGSGSVLTGHLYTVMTGLPHWRIISELEVSEVQAMDQSGGGKSARVRRLGKNVYADAVLFGKVLRFRDRVGGGGGVKSPASVAFGLYLLDVKRGDVIWSASFQETQRPLSDNLLALGEFTRRGARWLKAEELALEGVEKALKQLHRTLYGRTAPQQTDDLSEPEDWN